MAQATVLQQLMPILARFGVPNFPKLLSSSGLRRELLRCVYGEYTTSIRCVSLGGRSLLPAGVTLNRLGSLARGVSKIGTGGPGEYLFVSFEPFCGYIPREDIMNPHTVLWIYIVLLLIGGLIGFLKAGSKISLITSAVAAALLIVAGIPGLFTPSLGRGIADAIMAALLVVFAIRLAKTRKFMPSGLMLVITGAALALRHL